MGMHRLKQLATALNLTVNQFEEEIGATQSRIARAIQRDSKITRDLVLTIVERFPNVNSDWLLTGHGDMFLMEKPGKPNYLASIPTDSYKKPENLLQKAIKAINDIINPVSSADMKRLTEAVERVEDLREYYHSLEIENGELKKEVAELKKQLGEKKK